MTKDRVAYWSGAVLRGRAEGAVSPPQCREDLDGGVDAVEVWSPGGDALAGIEIAHMVAEADVEVRVRTEAASAASVIALAGRELLMTDSARVMIHRPQAWAGGDAGELRRIADVVEDIEGQYLALLSGHLPKWSRESIQARMAAETYLTRDELAEAGVRVRRWAKTEPAMVAMGGVGGILWKKIVDERQNGGMHMPDKDETQGAVPEAPEQGFRAVMERVGEVEKTNRPLDAAPPKGETKDTPAPVLGPDDRRVQLTATGEQAVAVTAVEWTRILAALDVMAETAAEAEAKLEVWEEERIAEARQAAAEEIAARAVAQGKIPPAAQQHLVTWAAVDPEAARAMVAEMPATAPVAEIGTSAAGQRRIVDTNHRKMLKRAGLTDDDMLLLGRGNS